MKDSSKIWLGVGVTAIVSLGGYLGYKHFFKPETQTAEDQIIDQATNVQETSNRPSSGSSKPSVQLKPCEKIAKYPIVLGAEGKQIEIIQKFINRFHPDGSKVSETCVFDQKTLNLLKDIARRGGSNKQGVKWFDPSKITERDYNKVVFESLRTGKLTSSALGWS